MKTKSRMRHEILLASGSVNFSRDFRRATSARDFILAAVDSPRKLTLLQEKKTMPDIAILDLDSVNKNLCAFIFYLKRFREKIPVVVISHNSDASLLDAVNKNLSVLLFLPRPTNKQTIKDLYRNVYDFFNEDFKKKLTKVEYLKEENVFACAFTNKEIFFIKRDGISEDNKDAEVLSCEISADRYFFVIKYDNGESTDVPWDFIRSIADQNYEFCGKKEKKKNGNITAEEIGQRIGKARESKNMTQEDLAAKTGILRNNLSRIEHGHHHPSLPVLEKIAEALDIPVVNLLAR